jgi:hypothetical protein
MQERSSRWSLACQTKKRFEMGKCAMGCAMETVGCPRIGMLSANDLEVRDEGVTCLVILIV